MPSFNLHSCFSSAIAILLFVVCNNVSFAQDRNVMDRECQNRLDNIKSLFEKGKLPEIEQIIKDTSETGFTQKCLGAGMYDDDEKKEIYEILTETFIELNKEEEADIYLERLLHIQPDYEVNLDKPDIGYLHSRFKVDPVFSLELSFAPNLSTVNVLQRYSVDNTSIINETYAKVPGYTTGLKITLPIKKYLELAGGLHFSLRRFQYEDELITFPTSLEGIYGTLTYTESQSWLDIPVNARVIFPVKGYKIRPYIFAGFNLHFLLTADLKDLRRLSGNGIEEAQSFSLISTAADLRAKANFSVTGGFGIRYPVRLNYLFADFAYSTMVSNLVNTDQRYANETLVYKIGYVDNDFRLSNMVFTVGFGRSFYNPELRKRYKKELDAYQADKKAYRSQKKAANGQMKTSKPKKEKPKKERQVKEEDIEEGKGKVEEGKGKAEEGKGKIEEGKGKAKDAKDKIKGFKIDD
ncbi:MAG: outer membrane beta-barrel protein [Bacteroidota bacterium]